MLSFQLLICIIGLSYNIAEKFKLLAVKIYAYATSTTASVNGLGQCPTILWDDKGVDEDTVPTYSAFKEQMVIRS